MSLSSYIIWFAVTSCTWGLFESLYPIVCTGHWSRRGSLYGPLCPIYGAGFKARPEGSETEHNGWESQ